MSELFVTLGTYGREQAKHLIHELNENGIDAYSEALNQILPSVSVGTQIKVKAEDVSAALTVQEKLNSNKNEERPHKKFVLVPYCYDEYSYKVFPIAFAWANALHADIVLFHTYTVESRDQKTILKRIIGIEPEQSQNKAEETHIREKEKANKFAEDVRQMVKAGKLAQANVRIVLEEGVPEEQIVEYANIEKPLLVAMSTRSVDRKKKEMIGSVSAEVSEDAPVPVLVLPETSDIKYIDDLKQITFVTNFEDRDIVAFDKMMTRLSFMHINLHLAHFQMEGKEDIWSDIKLSGIKNYFEENYPNVDVEYHTINGEDPQEMIKRYTREHKMRIAALSTQRKSLISRMFNVGMVRNLITESDTPMIVFHP